MLFIRSNDTLPVVACEAYNMTDVMFVNNVLQTEDTDLAAQLIAMGYELVADDDPRREWILTQGWSRQAQRDYARQPVTVEEPQPEE